MKIDLHIHTTYSDGAYSPEQVVDTALDCNLDVIALTDHDNILSHKVAMDYVKKQGYNLEIIPGVEINTIYKGYEVHILGYYMDTNNPDFVQLLKNQQQARINQTTQIVELLNKKAGIRVKFEDIKSLVAPGGSIGRPHIARAITAVGGVANVMEAYSKYINDSSPVYVTRKTVSPHDAVEIINEAGGIPVFAHPIDVDISEKLTKELVSYGLRGIEAYHRKHSPAVVEYFSSLAEKYGLIITGGSDFHAPSMNHGAILMGKNFVPSWVYDELIKEKKRIDMS
ncbi:TPA: PHP domain-containing protein [Candidatus Galligastranaerophilus intestinavium]|uniref:PHP domain-containing protein n=1 Tax=Candidatus Galligastranaerophilus intestinavium TaxID=2840836 RepID=A0A9D1FHT3_9BACT|nr:PHP domain-containing protein [Candidatus Galligastranaerophilus intestinavium]